MLEKKYLFCYLLYKIFSSQHDPEVIVKVIDSLRLLLYDDNVLVQKKLIVSMIAIYRLTLKVKIIICQEFK